MPEVVELEVAESGFDPHLLEFLKPLLEAVISIPTSPQPRALAALLEGAERTPGEEQIEL